MSLRSRHGFTLTELLIVIVVIAILAAISAVTYNGIQARARVSAKELNINTLEKKVQSYTIMNGGLPNFLDQQQMRDLELAGLQSELVISHSADACTNSAGGQIADKSRLCVGRDASRYSIFWWNDQTKTWWFILQESNGGERFMEESGTGEFPDGIPW